MSCKLYTVKYVYETKILLEYSEYKKDETSDNYLLNNEYINNNDANCLDYKYDSFTLPIYDTFDFNLPEILKSNFKDINTYTKINKKLVNNISKPLLDSRWISIDMNHNFISTIYTDYNFNIIINYNYFYNNYIDETNNKDCHHPTFPIIMDSWKINILFPDSKYNYEINVGKSNLFANTNYYISPIDNIISYIKKYLLVIKGKNIYDSIEF